MPIVDDRPRTSDDVATYLAARVGELLGSATVAPDANLFDLGLESLMLVELKERVRDELGVTLKFSDFFTYFTITDLATVVADRMEATR